MNLSLNNLILCSVILVSQIFGGNDYNAENISALDSKLFKIVQVIKPGKQDVLMPKDRLNRLIQAANEACQDLAAPNNFVGIINRELSQAQSIHENPNASEGDVTEAINTLHCQLVDYAQTLQTAIERKKAGF